ncbi:VWA domain-containing protein [Sulfitobacter mediterraneus]|uniref:vWA domain-containing protein n=1 Tax=Sulfitobacter mediterraneus TaxID=83219 RepID=UPI001933DD2C|nr:VWA domain-containing protein [Sulfitobacter mediterraneus]MBM1632346.1 VWA domain-containing protein [Sulfitobacter mediterraneus]MBM1640163.1 VWA domain-containing protein [Sulfitobacter mediterraneus]MBM1644211.1 VWA domain-containing protein [Sulfitobacter mediterraneus]MBM1648258.1 VWA domain-containing protein [Sulfitobacter mediterraneus]MBM1652303.1 VWA domain-containing protein [Sulfitobacter mediterraneus]
MAEHLPLDLPDDPKLAGNITHFARALRRAGLPIGPGRVIDAIRAVQVAGFTEKRDFYWTLHACFVNRPEHRRVFAQIFRLYWRDPRYLEHMMSAMLPAIRGVQEDRPAQAAEKRAAEALLDGADAPLPQDEDETAQDDPLLEVDASLTMSATERLRQLDFEQMSLAEIAQAKRMLARLTLPVKPLPSRRAMAAPRGRIDAARTLRGALRRGGEMHQLVLKTPRPRYPNLVVLCDISGSMSQYSRMILHFLHAVSNAQGAGWARVHAFTFGTRLTNITRHLATRDVDAALAAAGAEAQDWEGGTRIGASLEAFNRDWSRRVMGQGAVVLLITDGLDRDAPEDLGRQMQRLHLTARRLIWLNPLLRWDGFAPKAAGIRAMLPHVDSFRAGHSIASLEALAEALSRPDDSGEKQRLLLAMEQ